MRAALDWATRHRLELWKVMYRVMLAELLARRGDPADLTEARTVLAETLPEAERLGSRDGPPAGRPSSTTSSSGTGAASGGRRRLPGPTHQSPHR